MTIYPSIEVKNIYSLIRNLNFPGGRLHHHGGELPALCGNPSFHKIRLRILGVVPFTAIAASSTITPRIEIYTSVACNFLRPDYGEIPSPQQPATNILGFLHSDDCRIPVLASQSSCGDISDIFMIDNLESLQINAVDAPPTRKQRCASDPVVQAAVAKLTTGAYRFIIITSTCTCSSSRHEAKAVEELRRVV